MLEHKELIKTKEYHLEIIQNELFRRIDSYMNRENLNDNELAKKVGINRTISQILNGNQVKSVGNDGSWDTNDDNIYS